MFESVYKSGLACIATLWPFYVAWFLSSEQWVMFGVLWVFTMLVFAFYWENK